MPVLPLNLSVRILMTSALGFEPTLVRDEAQIFLPRCPELGP